MRPPHTPYRLAQARSAAAGARARAARVAEERAAALKTVRRSLPVLLLAALMAYCLRQALIDLAALPVAPWVQIGELAGLPGGCRVWVEGEVHALPAQAVYDPCADEKVVSCSLVIRRQIRRVAWDPVLHRLEPLIEERTTVSERGGACLLRDTSGQVVVSGATPEQGRGLVFAWQDGQPLPAALARIPGLFSVVPGEKVVALTVLRARIREGDRVGLYGCVGRDREGHITLAPPPNDAIRVLDGGHPAWSERRVEAALPCLALAFAAGFLALLARWGRKRSLASQPVGIDPGGAGEHLPS